MSNLLMVEIGNSRTDVKAVAQAIAQISGVTSVRGAQMDKVTEEALNGILDFLYKHENHSDFDCPLFQLRTEIQNMFGLDYRVTKVKDPADTLVRQALLKGVAF